MRNIVRYIRQSLSRKLSLGILLMAAPIFMLAIGILFIQSRYQVKQEATKHASSVLNTTMQGIRQYMNVVETATDVNDWEITEYMNPDSILALSRYIVMLNPNIDGCSISAEPNVFSKYGRYFSAYTVRENDTVKTVVEEPYEYFDRKWYKKPRELGKPCWVIYFDDQDLDLIIEGMLASYSKPIYNADKQFVGVISTDLSLLRLSKLIAAEKPYTDSYYMMVGDEGRYYLHPDTALLFKKTIFSDVDPQRNPDIVALGHEMTTGKQGSMSVMINGERCLVCYQPVPGAPCSLALVCPERSVLQSYNRLGFIITPLIIIGLLMILVFSSVTVAHAILPLYKLTGKLQRIADGHYDERISTTHYKDVVGRMQNSFAMMQDSLFHHVNDIEQMNAEAARRNEELVHTSELAKESDRQKSLFIQNVSHQIRTPLNIIMGFAHVLKESKGCLPEEETKGITDMMWHNAQMLNRMVMMLFDSSVRGTTEELYANRDEEVSCNEVAHESMAYVLRHFPELVIKYATEAKVKFVILQNKQGRTRLSKWYITINEEEKIKIQNEVYRTIILRDIKESNIIEYKNYKIVYKKYASLYFMFGIDINDNELASLELIHLFVETLDKYFGSVCELDVVYNFYKVYTVLDELLVGGEIVETSKVNILKKLREIEFYE